MVKKMNTPHEILCKGLPSNFIIKISNLCIKLFIDEFAIYMQYVKLLKYDEKPDYKFLKKTFQRLFIRQNYELDYAFDWCISKNVKKYFFQFFFKVMLIS